jgi:cell division protein FtsZ
MVCYDTDFISPLTIRPKITVLGIGGAGGNTINAIIKQHINNIYCAALNTDAQALDHVICETKLQLGCSTSNGLGTGANPEIGRLAAEEEIEKIIGLVHDSDIVFLIAGLGGGTGSGALPVIARMLQEHQILSIAIVTKPFLFEGSRRMNVAQNALQKVEEYVDTTMVIPNQKLFEQDNSQEIPLMQAFEKINTVIVDCIKAVADTIFNPGHINVDFADMKTTMTRMGRAVIGIGKASGANRAQEVIEKTLNSPLLEHTTLKGARSILLNIHGNHSLTLHEMNTIAGFVHEQAHPDAHIIVGSSISENMQDELQLTMIATGFEDFSQKNKPINRNAPHQNYYNNYQQKPIINNQNQHYNQKQQSYYQPQQPSQSSYDSQYTTQKQDIVTTQAHANNIEVPTFFRKNNPHDHHEVN